MNPIRDFVVRKVSDDRFCLVFHHIEDLRQVMEMRPWNFDKNLILLQPLSHQTDPLTINLDWCPFFVHIHDLRYGQCTVEVVRYIGNYLGSWSDSDSIDRDIYWFETIRIHVNINVTLPLKSALKLRSESGEECVVRFSYERLPNFCYLCGLLGHISRLCSRRFQEGFTDPGSSTPYGAWLRATGPSKSLGGPVRPTYVWNSPSPLRDSSAGSLRGIHIFGGFRTVDASMRLSPQWAEVVSRGVGAIPSTGI
ncbi:hypothetical protein Salat_2627000 [Sesamum alatum]|uniref:CCHC-type domain-containing protein n=1 Tax=Sesamum alatum TaxID=300844 RepID=A0AAE1XPN4_9LAMI|nr:hypothetical protein Salat_2627000 [Sesamum alatum]